MKVLSDHHMTEQAFLLWSGMEEGGWLELAPVPLVTFAEMGLAIDSSDREVWRFAQEHNLILLTANRNMKGDDSLEQTIREENKPTSLPVVTVSVLERLRESTYRDKCIVRLTEILMRIENYLGSGRVFIP
jgi:predicted nuclease of predicted toxin-antitoxin system